MEYNPRKLAGQSAEKTFYTTQVRFWPGVFKRCAVWGYKRVGNDIQETSCPRFQSNLSESTISCYRFEYICMRMCTWQSIQIHRRDNPKRKAFRNSPPRLQLQHLFVGTLSTFWRNQPRDTSLENPPTKISAWKLCVCVRENTYNLVQNLSIPSWVCTCSYNLIGSKRMEMLTRSYKPIRETLGCR